MTPDDRRELHQLCRQGGIRPEFMDQVTDLAQEFDRDQRGCWVEDDTSTQAFQDFRRRLGAMIEGEAKKV